MPKYAQINAETGLVVGESWLKEEGMEKRFPQLIPIASDVSPLGMKYDFETKSFVEYIPPVEPEQETEVLEEPGVIAE